MDKARLSERYARQTRNEALFREVNEQIAQVDDAERQWSTLEIMCECGAEGGCGERVEIPLDAYERVRSQDDRFVVRPGHETPELEHAVEWGDEYVIVDKIEAAEPLVENDPRGAPSE